MKRLLMGGLTAVLVAAGLALTAPVEATQPPTVHHPECPDGQTLIKDQPPYSGLSVEVKYPGTLWIKAGPQHFPVPVVSVGEVYTPQGVSGWPMNRPGNAYLEISHVDYCTPETPPTTPPPTTAPPTTAPPTTAPPTTAPPTTAPPTTAPPTTAPPTTAPPTTQPPVTIPPVTTAPPPEVCIQHIVPGPDLAEGDYVINPVDPTGTTRWGILPCSPPPPPEEPPPVTTTPELPSTGSNATGWMLSMAVLAGLSGLGLIGLARRRTG